MNKSRVDPQAVAITAVMTAVVFVLTRAVQIPTPARGYIHLGDAGVFFGALAFGPWVGAAAGGLGTALSDLTSGYPQWAIFSLIIHGAQGWLVGWASRRLGRGVGGMIAATVLGGIVVVVGYLGAGMLLSGVGAAIGELPLNVIQVAAGAVVGVPLFLLVRQGYPPLGRYGRRLG